MPKTLSKKEFYEKYYPMVAKAISETGSPVLPETAMAQLIAENGYREFDPQNPVFGVKAEGSTGGNVVTKKTKEVIDGKEKEVDAEFRVYDTFGDAVKGYLSFLESNPRYEEALKGDTAAAQLKGIADAGYATAPNYAESLATINSDNESISVEYAEKTQLADRIPADGVPYVKPETQEVNGVNYSYIVMPNGDEVPMAMTGIDPRFKRIGNDLYFSNKKYGDNSTDRQYVKIPSQPNEKYNNGYWPTEGNNFMKPLFMANNLQSTSEVYNEQLDYYAGLENPTAEQKAQAKRLLSNAGRVMGTDSVEFKKFGVKYFDEIFIPEYQAESQQVLAAQQKKVDDINHRLDDPNISQSEFDQLSSDLAKETDNLNNIKKAQKMFDSAIEKANAPTKDVYNPTKHALVTAASTVLGGPNMGMVTNLLYDSTDTKKRGLEDEYTDKAKLYDTWNAVAKEAGITDSSVTGNTKQEGLSNRTGGRDIATSDSLKTSTSISGENGFAPDKGNIPLDSPRNMPSIDEDVLPDGKAPGYSEDYLTKQISEIDEALGELGSAKPFEPDFSGLKTSDPMDNVMGNLMDVGRGLLGMKGVLEDTPKYEESGIFKEYVQDAYRRRDMGLDPEEEAYRRQLAERAFGYDVKNIRRLSGGSAGVALGNLGRASGGLQDRYAQIASEDSAVRRMNRARFDQAAGAAESVNRRKFEDDFAETMRNKQAGAQLVADSLRNIKERTEFEKQYGEGSIYNEYMKEVIASKQAQRAALEESKQLQTDRNKRELEKQKSEYQEALKQLKGQ